MEAKLNNMLNQLQELYDWYIEKLNRGESSEELTKRILELKSQINILKELRGE